MLGRCALQTEFDNVRDGPVATVIVNIGELVRGLHGQ